MDAGPTHCDALIDAEDYFGPEKHPAPFSAAANEVRIMAEEKRIEVWQIYEKSGCSNHFGVDRQDEWERKLVGTFPSEEEARKKVCDLTRSDPSTSFRVVPHLATCRTEKEKMSYLMQWCLNDECSVPFRRFFVGRPSTQLMKDMVQKAGLRFIPK